jgi:protein-tyrosine phosphatase
LKRILFVCLGNICRSPLAEGIFRAHVVDAGLEKLIEIDSAGTASWHQGKPPHPMSVRIAREYGIDLSVQRSRPLRPTDFSHFDLILTMDRSNLDGVRDLARDSSGKAEMRLFLSYAGLGERNIADPYGLPESAYRDTARILAEAAPAIATKLMER